MIAHLRTFLAVIEEGSLHRAAARLSISQSALSRQMQALEHDLGGRLLERTTTGVKPTRGGYELAEKAGGLLATYDATMLAVRHLLQGECDTLRIGAIGSAVAKYLSPGIKALRRSHPATKVQLLDLSSGEQIEALRRGTIDLALLNHGAELLARECYSRKIDTVSLQAILSANHPLAARRRLHLADLKDVLFVSGADRDMPGHRHMLTQLCQRSGKFRPQFVGQAESLADALNLVVENAAVLLMPRFVKHLTTSLVRMIPIIEPEAATAMVLVWQRGRVGGPLRSLLDALR